jgi:hypothetical protein
MATGVETTATIDGETYRFSRARIDAPNAEVVARRGDGVVLVIDTQYATIGRTMSSAPVAIEALDRAALVAAGRDFQRARHDAERSAPRPTVPAMLAAVEAETLDEAAAAAWDAGDEAGWARGKAAADRAAVPAQA